MRKLWFFNVMIALLLTSCLALVTAETIGWKPILRFQSPYVGIAGFSSETSGIIAGDHHHGIEITSDSAKTWTQKVVTRVNLWGMDFLDDKTFFCCGNQKVLVTEDGGTSWEFLAEFGDYEPDDCRFIRFLDRQTGWIATPQILAGTVDGGKTWSLIDLPKTAKGIVAIDYLDQTQGFLLDAGGDLHSTLDAGKTWSVLTMPWKGKMVKGVAPVAAIRFSDVLHGKVLMWRKTAQMELWALTTNDGGRNWQTEIIPVKFGGIFFARDGRTLTVSSINGEISVWQDQ